MTQLPSLRRRLRRLVIGTTLLAGALLAAMVWFTATQETDELLDETLQASAEVLATLMALQTPRAAPGGTVLPASRPQEYFAWQVVAPEVETGTSGANRTSAGPRLLLRSASAPERSFIDPPRAGFADAPGWRVHGIALPPEPGVPVRWLLVAQTRAERNEAAREIAFTAMAAALVLSLAIALFLRWRMAGVLAPLDQLSERLRRHDPTLGAPLGMPALAELAPVHDAVDELSERLCRRLANERAFSAHAAHALRTPLASIEAQLAVAQRDAPPGLEPRLARVRQATARLSRVVAALLALFRSGSELQRQPLRLATLIERLPLEGLSVQVDADAVLNADPDLLSAALLNLADNALRHGATAWTVHVATTADGAAVLTLHDNGSGMPPEQREHFALALAAQDYDQPGLGLGLMLADLVARAHGGALQLPAEGLAGPGSPGCAVALHLAQAAVGTAA